MNARKQRIEIVPGLVVCDPNIQQGAPVFKGTTVLVRTLVEYREGHTPLYEFLNDFPEIKQAQAKQFLEWWARMEANGVQDVLGWILAIRDENRIPGLPPKSRENNGRT